MPMGINPLKYFNTVPNGISPELTGLQSSPSDTMGDNTPYAIKPPEPIPQQQISAPAPAGSQMQKYSNDNSPLYLKDVPIPLSQNNPYLAYFPKKGSMMVPTRKLIAEAMMWENQEAIRQQGLGQQIQQKEEGELTRAKMAEIASKALVDASTHPDIMSANRDTMDYYNSIIPMISLPGGESTASSVLSGIGGLYNVSKSQKGNLMVNPVQYAQKLSDSNPYRNMLLSLGERNVPAAEIEKLMNQADDYEKSRASNSIEWAKLNQKDNKTNPAYIGLKEFNQNYYIPILRQQGLQVQQDKNGAITAILDGKGQVADKSKIPTPEEVLRNITTPELAQQTVASWFDPQGIGGLSDIPTTMSKRGRSMINKIPANAGFTKKDYVRADQSIVNNRNSFRQAYLNAVKSKDKALVRALRWRYVQLSGNDLNEQELYSLLSTGGN